MAYDIGPKIGIEGEKEFRKAINDINTNMKTLGTEMKAVASQFDKNDKSTEALTAKNEVLNKQIDKQKQKLSELQKGLAQAADKYGENDRVTQGWQQAVNRATADLNNMERELQSNNRTLEEGSKSAVNFQNAVSTMGKGVGKVAAVTAKSIAIMGAALAAATVAAVKWGNDSVGVFAEYEDSMKQVQATMGLTGEEGEKAFNKLSDVAKEAGSTTKFSASEAAEALNFLALAGYGVDEATNALPKVLNLAAAGGLELAYASDLVTDSMSALGLESNELDSFIDQLAKTSQKSNTNIAQLGEAILTVGGTAKVLAGGTDELNTALGILADNGTKGAEGGTALRNIILSLTAPTDKAATAIKRLGIDVADADGNLRPLNEIFKDLDKSLEGMSDIEKTNVLNNIFNKVDLKSVNALLDNTGDRFDELSGYIKDAEGAAKEMAETMESGLAGSIRSLSSAYEGLQIAIGEQLAGIKQSIVESTTGLVRDITTILNDGFQQGDIEAIGLRISEYLVNGIKGINQYLPELISMVTGMLTNIVDVLVQLFPELIPPLLDGAIQLLQGLIDAIKENIEPIIDMAMYLVTTLSTYILESLPMLIETGIEMLLALVEGITQMLPDLIPVAIDAILQLTETIIDNLDLIIDAGINLILALADGLIEALPTFIEKAPQIINSFWEAFDKNLFKILEAGVQLVIKLGVGIIKSIPKIIANAGEIVKAIFNTISHLNLLNVGKNIIKTLGQGLSGMTGNIFSIIKQLVQKIIKNFTSINWGSIGKDIIKGITGGIKSMAGGLAQSATDAAKGALNATKDFLGIKSPSRVMRDEVGKMIGAGMAEGIADSARQVNSAMQGLNNELQVESTVKANGSVGSLGQEENLKGSTGEYGGQELTINSYLNLDGKIIADNTSKVQFKNNNNTTRGMGVVPV